MARSGNSRHFFPLLQFLELFHGMTQDLSPSRHRCFPLLSSTRQLKHSTLAISRMHICQPPTWTSPPPCISPHVRLPPTRVSALPSPLLNRHFLFLLLLYATLYFLSLRNGPSSKSPPPTRSFYFPALSSVSTRR